MGIDVLGELPVILGDQPHRVAVVHPRRLSAAARRVADLLDAQPLLIEIPDGEPAKEIGVAARCWSELGWAGFTRSDAVVAVGGGAITDLAGFVAATWLRGIRVVHVPTTLLGMVDAAVGGKTAVNTPEGKNLVGAFHPPSGVICDLALLASLPSAEFVSGLAEVVKAGFIADPVILDLMDRDPAAATHPAGRLVRELIERAIKVKAQVVSADLRETASTTGTGPFGRPTIGREMLNYGHTLGHAIEKVERYRIRHGEAVAVGMLYAAELARLAGRLPADLVDQHREVLGAVGLPTDYPAAAWPDLLAAMKIDKKARGDRLRFVVLDGLARPAILEAPDPGLLIAAYAAVSA